MAATAGNLLVGVTGSIYMAPSGTALPTTVSASLNAAFADLGYISEDGVSTSTSIDTNDIKAWQNGDTVRKIQTGHDFQVNFTMLETNAKSLELYYGNYTSATNGKVEVKGVQGYRGCFVINVIDDEALVRIVLPDAQVTDKGDVSYVNADPASLPVTLTCYPDTSGVKAYLYFETDGAS